MRIAFDIDGTLTPLGSNQFDSVYLPWPIRFFFPEPLRHGTKRLFDELDDSGHEVWIYTSSLRRGLYIRLWFFFFGIRLGGVVNGDSHSNAVRHHPNKPSKFPPAFGIDLLVDDLIGVELEGKAHGFRVLIVEPLDVNWACKVKAAVQCAD
jgi:hypothetical protein